MRGSRQVEANRLNAKHSTGPRIDEGKARSSQNAITHGITAEHILLDTEDREEFIQVRAGIMRELMPGSQLELEFAERIVSIVWRLRRIPAFEAMILLGLSIDTFFRHDFSSKLSRYETSLQRQLTRLLTELRDMQSRQKNDLPEGREGSWVFVSN